MIGAAHMMAASSFFLVVEYTTTGSQTVSKPAGATRCTMECIGGGGGSSKVGGGGGAYSRTTSYEVSALSALYVTVPAGGPKNSNNRAGNAVVRATDSSGAILCSAEGGESSGQGSHANGGQAANSVGDIKHSGGNGVDLGGGATGGGGAGGPVGAGGDGTTSAGGASGGSPAGAGGAPLGGGNGFGIVGDLYGGGGGGGDGGEKGVEGAQGYVRLTWS